MTSKDQSLRRRNSNTSTSHSSGLVRTLGTAAAVALAGCASAAPEGTRPVPAVLDRAPVPIVFEHWIECYEVVREIRLHTSRTFNSWEAFERARGITLAFAAADKNVDFVVVTADRTVPRDLFVGVAARMSDCTRDTASRRPHPTGISQPEDR